MVRKLVNLKNINDIQQVAQVLNKDEVKETGIYVDINELRYYRVSPWISVYILYEQGEIAAFASINLAEKAWGRGEWMEFYLAPGYRGKMLGYRFYKDVLKTFEGCHRICAHVRVSNKPMYGLLVKLGWKTECVIRHYDREGKSYYQLSYDRGAKE